MTYNPKITDHDKRTVLAKLIPYNSEDSRIDVEELCTALHMPRRKLRAIVNVINTDESPEYAHRMILTDTDEGGYWLAVPGGNPNPAMNNIASELSRGTDILTKARAMERKTRRIYNQTQEALF